MKTQEPLLTQAFKCQDGFLIGCGGSSAVEHLPYKVFSSSYQHVQGPRFYQEKGGKEKSHLAVKMLSLAPILNIATQLRVCPSQRKERKKKDFCPMSSQEPLPPAKAETESHQALESTLITPTALWELTNSLKAQTLRSKHGGPHRAPQARPPAFIFCTSDQDLDY